MAETDVRWTQWIVVELFVAEREKPTCIHERLLKECGEATVDVSVVRR